MSRIIDKGLEEQSVLIVRMAEITYETLETAIAGYLNGRDVHQEVYEMSQTLLSMADKIENTTFQLIARYQPVATDLRTIKSYMKIANDFARYGRYSLDISTLNNQFNGLKECDIWQQEYIADMSQKVLDMVKISLNALRKYDVELARSITQTEREVDKMYLDFQDKLMNDANANSKCVLSSSLMTRYLERIADHATYVCESILYIVTGEKVLLR
jgi:phosphate transport system protein